MRLALALALATALSCAGAAAGDRPDARLTPGLADPGLTQQKLCAKDFRTGSVRAVSAATKKQVYAAYRLAPNQAPCPCEVDHLISLELGGANDPRNLWPQSYRTKPWNARVKDALEDRLHKLVCSGAVDLGAAQRAIAGDWTAAWTKYLGATK
jgi:hypothetical protein